MNAVIDKLLVDLRDQGVKVLLDPEIVRFRNPTLAEALKLWHQKAAEGAGGIPFRRDFTPQSMRPFLQKIALFEAVKQPPDSYRLRARLTGNEFARTFAEMSGKFIDECVPAKFLRRWTLIWEALADSRRPFRGLNIPEAFGRNHSVVEWLAAPLLDDCGDLTQALLVCNFEFGGSWEAVCISEEIYRRGVAAAPRKHP